jgi:hypothetical protein
MVKGKWQKGRRHYAECQAWVGRKHPVVVAWVCSRVFQGRALATGKRVCLYSNSFSSHPQFFCDHGAHRAHVYFYNSLVTSCLPYWAALSMRLGTVYIVLTVQTMATVAPGTQEALERDHEKCKVLRSFQ